MKTVYVLESSIALNKILHDYEKYGKSTYMLCDLHNFAVQVLKQANNNNEFNEFYTLLHFGMTLRPLDLITNIVIPHEKVGEETGYHKMSDMAINIDREKYLRNKSYATINSTMAVPVACLNVIYNTYAKEDEKFFANTPANSIARKK